MAKAMPHKLPGFGRVMRRVLDRRSALVAAGHGRPAGTAALRVVLRRLCPGLHCRQCALRVPIWTLLFGLGTLPALLLLGGGAATLWQRFRPQAELLAGLIMVGMAVALLSDAWAVFF